MKPRPLDPLALPLTGTQLIEASAGTGKTYTITTIVLRLLLEAELNVDQIVVVTFTRAATSELRDRIRQRIAGAAAAFEEAARGKSGPGGDDPILTQLVAVHPPRAALGRLQKALRDLDRAAIFTIHGFAQRMLQEHAFESGARFDLELVGEQRLLVTEVAHDFWAREIATLSEECWRALQVCNVTLRSVVALAHVAAAAPDLPLNPDLSAATSSELEQSLSELAAAWAAAAEAYRLGGREALALLAVIGFNQKYYSEKRLGEYHRELETVLQGRPQLFKSAPAAFKCLAAGSIKCNKGHHPPDHALFDALAHLNEVADRCHTHAAAFTDALRCRLVRFARERVALEHGRAGTQSFDDLLYGMRDALRKPAQGAALARHVCERFPVALIDEFQDTDPVQYEIFKRIYGRPKKGAPAALFLIGDPKQAIYAFRGADIDAYLEAARDAADGAWTLTTNYRSDPGFVAALNRLFGRLERPFMYPQIGYTAVSAAPGREDCLLRRGGPVAALQLVYLGRQEAGRGDTRPWEGTAEWQRLAAEEVARLLSSDLAFVTGDKSETVEPRHVAVLTRTNRQAQDIQEHLRQLGVPSVLQGDRTVFEAPEAVELALILRALAEPANGSALRTALATRFLGLDAPAILGLMEDEPEWEGWVLRFRDWNSTWAERGLMQCLERILREQQVVQRTLQELDGERRMTNLRHLAELLHQAESERHLGIPGLLQWFDEARTDPSRHGMAPEAQQLRLESDADAVVLTTMHKSKGLEYPIVVLPFLGAKSAPFGSEQENLKFHNPEHDNRLELDVRAREHKASQLEIAQGEHQAEAMRLAYVALTRARHQCIVLWGGVTGAFSSLGYLLHQPVAELGGLGVELATRLRDLDDELRLAELEALAAASDGAIQVRRARLGLAPTYQKRTSGDLHTLAARRLQRRVPAGIRTSSFSAMTRAIGHQMLSTQARDGRDVDEGTLREALVSSAEGTQADAGSAERPVTLADFPRGPKPGDLLHSVLEKIPLAGGDSESRRPIIEAELRRHGFAVEHLLVVRQAVEEILATSFGPESSLTLGSLLPHQRLREMEFTLPVVVSGEGALTAQGLAEVLSRETNAPWNREYLGRVARLGFSAWAGFLRGFVDLIFEHDGKYYVADYKSNHLGSAPDDYRRTQLDPVMAEHHYHLQYVLYSVALHRYLQQRLDGYSIERNFGGVYYLFLRGLHPSTGAGRGVFFHRPSATLIEGMSTLLAGSEVMPCA